jgi:hypothetical protein
VRGGLKSYILSHPSHAFRLGNIFSAFSKKLEVAIPRPKKVDLDYTDEEDVDEHIVQHEPDDHEEDFDID